MSATFTRTVTPNPGHFGKSLKFAKIRIAAIKEYCGVDVELNVRLGGPGGQILMVSRHAHLSEIEDMRRKVMEGVLAGAIPQPKGKMIGSVNDAIWLSA